MILRYPWKRASVRRRCRRSDDCFGLVIVTSTLNCEWQQSLRSCPSLKLIQNHVLGLINNIFSNEKIRIFKPCANSNYLHNFYFYSVLVSRINMLYCTGYHGSDILVKLMPHIPSKAVSHLNDNSLVFSVCWNRTSRKFLGRGRTIICWHRMRLTL